MGAKGETILSTNSAERSTLEDCKGELVGITSRQRSEKRSRGRAGEGNEKKGAEKKGRPLRQSVKPVRCDSGRTSAAP